MRLSALLPPAITGTSAPANSAPESLHSIPLFDLRAIGLADGRPRRELVEAFGEALRTHGFIAIKAPEMQSIYEVALNEAEAYFSLPVETKMDDYLNNGNQSGYAPEGQEKGVGAPQPDLKEYFHVPPNFNQWPKGRPGFEKAMKDFHELMAEYAAQVIGLIGEYLEVSLSTLEGIKNCEAHLLRIVSYPPKRPTDHPDAVRAAAHLDLNTITLLPSATAPGLQLMGRDGEWEDVIVPPGYLVVNTGEALEQLTAGMFPAVLHRVANPTDQYAYTSRITFPFFGSLPSDFSLTPLPICVERMTRKMSINQKEAHLAKYPPGITVRDFLLSRLIELTILKSPDWYLVDSLRGKGLLKNPPREIGTLYPDLFE